jgi:rhamnosyltransferase
MNTYLTKSLETTSTGNIKYSVGIVAYYPNLDQLIHNIRSYCLANSVLIVFDNTDDHAKASVQRLKLELEFPNVLYLGEGRNTGIGHALNRIFEISKSKGLTACLTMDQDSSFENFNEYIEFAEMNKEHFSYLSPAYSKDPSDIDRYFTSGSLVTIDSWEAVGGFNAQLFIDEVDGDFVYRLQHDGFKLLKFQGSLLTHQLGESKCIPVFSRKICSANHSPIRKYYIARNRTYFFIRRKQMRWIYLKDSALKLLQFIVVEENRSIKMKMIIRGVIDGLKGNLGEYRDR